MIRIPANQVDFTNLDTTGIPIEGKKQYIRDFPVIDTGWKVKKWFKIDLEKLQAWYANLEANYGDWKFIQGQHNYMWQENPSDPTGATGHKLMDDSAWYNLCWSPVEREGVLPPERSNAKPEYRESGDLDQLGLYPRKCFDGYMLEIAEEIEKHVRVKKLVISILTPGTVLHTHQDAPDKFRFHIALHNNEDSYWIIDGERIRIPTDGWVYIVNTSLPHAVYNEGDTPSIKVYGKIYTEDVLKLDLT